MANKIFDWLFQTDTDPTKTGIPDIVTSTNNTVQKKIKGISINASGSDTPITGLPAKYRITKMSAYDSSTNLGLSLATLGLFTGPGGTGTAIVALGLLTALTTIANTLDFSLPSTLRTEGTLYINNGIPHGTPATVDVLFEYVDLT